MPRPIKGIRGVSNPDLGCTRVGLGILGLALRLAEHEREAPLMVGMALVVSVRELPPLLLGNGALVVSVGGALPKLFRFVPELVPAFVPLVVGRGAAPCVLGVGQLFKSLGRVRTGWVMLEVELVGIELLE